MRPEPTTRSRGGLAVAILLLAAALAPFAAGLAWPLDLLASVAWGFVPFTLLATSWWTARRRWRLLIVGMLALALHAVILAQPRAARATGEATVRVLLFNVAAPNQDHSRTLDIVLAADADVVVLIEPRYRLLRALRESAEIAEAFPHAVLPLRSDPIGWCIVLSRWPQRPLDDTQFMHASVTDAPDLRVVDAPDGAFVLAVAHPLAPRSWANWSAGNTLVRRLAGRVRTLDMSVIVAADLNSTPGGWRSRFLTRDAGVRRARPRTTLGGTYPARWPRPFRVAIDDLWVSGEFRVVRWSIGDAGGSDHCSVIVELRRTGQRTGGEPEGPPP